MTDLMASYGDPRQGSFGTSTVGFPYGLTRDNAVKFANDNPSLHGCCMHLKEVLIHPGAVRR